MHQNVSVHYFCMEILSFYFSVILKTPRIGIYYVYLEDGGKKIIKIKEQRKKKHQALLCLANVLGTHSLPHSLQV